MNDIKKWFVPFQRNSILVFFIFYVLFRIFILNLNSAEWGDSYRILRATEFLENWEYPLDEKRPPFFSIVLLLGNFFGGEVFGGRVVMMVISIAILLVFYLLIKELLPKSSIFQRLLVLAFLGFNPLFVYWSMRIYADSLFLLISLLSILVVYKFQKYWWHGLVLALLSIIGIYTRFEGYILLSTIVFYYSYLIFWKKKFLFVKHLLMYFISISVLLGFLINLEFFHYQNPLSSSYFDEAESRSFSFRELGPTFLQLLFLSGAILGAIVMGWEWKKLINFFHSHPLIAIYTFTFVLLSSFWYPAVPRLFLQILPFLVLVMFICLFSFFERVKEREKNFQFFSLSIFLFIMYILGQLLFKTQLLITNRLFFVLFVVISLVSFLFLLLRKSQIFYAIFLLNIFFWMLVVLFDHAKTFDALSKGVSYIRNIRNSEELVLTNDVSSLSGFYLGPNLKYSGNLDSGKKIEELVQKEKPKYILYTNEHNPDLEFLPEKYPFMKVLNEFSFENKGRMFVTIVLEVSSN